MNRSTKVTRILLVAAFAAGLTACSDGGDPAAAPTASVSASASVSEPAVSSEPAVPSSSPSDPAATVPEATASASASPSEKPLRGADGELLGDVKLSGANAITVAPEGEKAQKVELTPFTEVLDVQGAICSEGKIPHKCTTDQLRKALKSAVSFYAKVTVKDGTATKIEEIVPE
ncbi:hypothetical protein [Streptosporangium minutum]|uniref:hypothetical protein n=1 Tax=Streptosporangium minutum TaxID=569862 RepID=UPI00105488BB|nr:hypothetical protein [Streptosporangium minutum]